VCVRVCCVCIYVCACVFLTLLPLAQSAQSGLLHGRGVAKDVQVAEDAEAPAAAGGVRAGVATITSRGVQDASHGEQAVGEGGLSGGGGGGGGIGGSGTWLVSLLDTQLAGLRQVAGALCALPDPPCLSRQLREMQSLQDIFARARARQAGRPQALVPASAGPPALPASRVPQSPPREVPSVADGSSSAAAASTGMHAVLGNMAQASDWELTGALGVYHVREDAGLDCDSPSYAAVSEADEDQQPEPASTSPPEAARHWTAVVLKRHQTPTAAGRRSGVGVQFHKAPGAVGPFRIADMAPDGSARQSGRIMAGDWLHAVDNTCVHELDTQRTTELILGAPGSPVTLWIRTPQSHSSWSDGENNSTSTCDPHSNGAEQGRGHLALLEMPRVTWEMPLTRRGAGQDGSYAASEARVAQGLQPTYFWQGGQV
jgi:hypothetical protein